jgi:hypothetical protein
MASAMTRCRNQGARHAKKGARRSRASACCAQSGGGERRLGAEAVGSALSCLHITRKSSALLPASQNWGRFDYSRQ